MTEHALLPRRTLRTIVREHLHAMRWFAAAATVVTLGATLLNLAKPWPLKVIFDNVLGDEPLPGWLSFLSPVSDAGDTSFIVVLATTVVLLAAGTALLEYLQTMITTRLGHRLVARIRGELFDHLQALPLTYHRQARRGELITKSISDTQKLKETFSEHAILFISNTLTLVGVMIVMALVNWRLALIPLMSLPLLAGLYVYFGQRLRTSVKRQRSREGKLNSHLAEILGAMSIVQAFGREQHESKTFEANNEENVESGIESTQIAALMNGAIGLVSSVGLALVVLFGAVGVNNGRLTLGELLVFTTYVRTIYRPIKQLVKLAPKFTRARVSAARIDRVLAAQPGVEDAPGARAVHQLRGEIEFVDVGFSYDGEPVLEHLSFHIAAGERVALMGPSGAGKTTVASLILRLFDPVTGHIRIDGEPISAFRTADLRRLIGYVPQDSLLMGMSIAENIRYGNPTATDAEIVEAARQADIHDHIAALPAGYDTPVGETGATLSGGQRQRLALARALVKDPALLILDEPTSSLDATSCQEVLSTLTNLFHGRTIVAITHDPNVAATFDRSIVIGGPGSDDRSPTPFPRPLHGLDDGPGHRLVIMGQGYVGLPLAMRAVEAGMDVVGFDVDQARVNALAAGTSFVTDVPNEQIAGALATGRYLPTADAAALRCFDTAVISVPTPLQDGRPDLRFVEKATQLLGPSLTPGATVVLESTTYPGTTEELVGPILEDMSGLKAGVDFWLGYSPERINPGDGVNTFVTIPKVVSGLTPESLDAIAEFYAQLVDQVVPVGSPKVAELTKLLENTFRHVNIALINELAMFAHELDIDMWEAIDAADTKPFGFMAFRPGPGVGGHCLPVDPSYLSWNVQRSLGRPFRFVELANDINEHMPDYVVSRTAGILNELELSIHGRAILLVGMAYKRNTGDARESPAKRIAGELVRLGATVSVAEPHVSDRDLPVQVRRVHLDAATIDASDMVVLLVDHDVFDYDVLVDCGKPVLDCTKRLPAADNVEFL